MIFKRFRGYSPIGRAAASRQRRSRFTTTHWLFISLALILFTEVLHHGSKYYISRPSTPKDEPFAIGCQVPDPSTPRENAVILMLARNDEVEGARKSMLSVEQKFNQWYHYDVLFLNDEPFDQNFKDTLSAVISGKVSFETIPSSSSSSDNSTKATEENPFWGFPPWINAEDARSVIAGQDARGIKYGSKESYHHMCRFNAGRFFDHPALLPYRYYWRVEPNIEFLCSITYDPFRHMARNNKVYGYVMAIWELPVTVPTLFRHIADYKEKVGIGCTDYWRSFVSPSWLPWPVRSWVGAAGWRGRDREGDVWNWCHYWSNFEIADMEWYRGREYRDFFEMLDRAGGIYYERWGDAPIHSLAAALLLQPEQTHHFSDFGYTHDGLQSCPANAAGKQLLESDVLSPSIDASWNNGSFVDGVWVLGDGSKGGSLARGRDRGRGRGGASFWGGGDGDGDGDGEGRDGNWEGDKDEDEEGDWVGRSNWDDESSRGEGCRCQCKKDISVQLSQRVCGWELGRAIS
ncbi:hypothetical protein MMC25_002756 [Agyrium rufum]|nr:hypothetical protein [Agyrium rufum]